MSPKPIRALLIEDDEDDYLLTRELFADMYGGGFELDWVADYDAGLEAICRGDHDVYLLDYRLGPRDGLELLREATARSFKGPAIVLTGQGERELDVAAMKAGAADFLDKGRLDAASLERAIRYAVNQRRHADDLERRVRERTDELETANAALREYAERFRFMAESMPQKIFTARPNGDIDYFNRQWMEFTGLSFEQTKDWGWTRFVHPDDLGENVRLWRHAVATGEPFQLEHRFRRADGVYRWHLSRARAMRGAAGDVVMWIGSSTEIDDMKQAEEALKETDRRKDEFLAMLAHELRNPLAPIRNALQVLQMKGSDDPDVVWARGVVERQVDHLVRLVDDLLDVSRISRGKITLRKERVDLTAVVARAVESSRPFIESRKHELDVTLPEGATPVEADAVRLAQVLLNLLNNAAKFTPPGGRISLSVTKAGGESAAPGQGVIRVRDTGEGIPAEMLARVFDLFTQVEQTRDRAEGGLGIGLTLVRRLTEMHGGTVDVSSDGPNKGSEFVVRLPLLPEEPSPARVAGKPETETAPRPAVSGRRILVVDDNRDSAESLAMLLRLFGNEVRTAHDGKSAVETASAYHPDVVLLDIGLPGMDGLEVCRHLRQQPDGERMLLVAMTGYGQEDDKRRSREAGFNAHLVKPVDFDALQQLLASPELTGQTQI